MVVSGEFFDNNKQRTTNNEQLLPSRRCQHRIVLGPAVYRPRVGQCSSVHHSNSVAGSQQFGEIAADDQDGLGFGAGLGIAGGQLVNELVDLCL